ncbi:MAG TPA: hypothetical protein VN959_05870 [Mycobacterium sp.]|nr:hypothetical protein [Mycobacterium sp.]
MPRSSALICIAAALVAGCAAPISGTPTWPGARLDKVLLTEPDFPPGAGYGRIVDQPGQPDNAGGPPAMMSSPQGCSNGLTDVIAAHAERGPGSAAKYSVIYNGARIVMTVLTSQLSIGELAAEANRCHSFNAYFDRNSPPIPITTTKLPSSRPGQLVYQQTMQLRGINNSVYMSFENIGRMAVFGIAFPTMQLSDGNPPPPKASLPQTFTEIVDRQAQRIQDAT